MKMLMRSALLCLVCFSQMLAAVEIDDLFEAEVIANSEQEHDRVAAIKQALSIVLTRVLAGDAILQDDTVRTVIANAMNYVVESQFSLVAVDKKNNSHARLMRVQFDEKALIDVLRPGKLGFWNEIRSRTLVWLIVEEQGNPQFFEPNLMPDIDAAMNKASQMKALPILYPIQDLNEKRRLSISDVLSAYSDHLLDVSLRYDVVSTLAGKLIKKDDCWMAEWSFYFDEKIKQWRSTCQTIEMLALDGLQGVYDTLSLYYAVQPDRKEIASVILKISNIKSVKDLETVTDYLDALDMVKTVTWVKTSEGRNEFRIFYQGRRWALNHALSNDRILGVDDFSRQNEAEVNYKLLLKEPLIKSN